MAGMNEQWEWEKYMQKMQQDTKTQPATLKPASFGTVNDWQKMAQNELNATYPTGTPGTNATQAAKLASDYPKTTMPSQNAKDIANGLAGNIGTGAGIAASKNGITDQIASSINTGAAMNSMNDLAKTLAGSIDTGANAALKNNTNTDKKPTGTKPSGGNGSKNGSGTASASASASSSTQNNIITAPQLQTQYSNSRQEIGPYNQSQATQDAYAALQAAQAGQPDAYQYSPEVLAAQQALNNLTASRPAAYQSKYGAQLDDLLAQIQNPGQFKYEFNGDNLFKAYADQYTQRGKQASLDAMGQAAALNGGYGSSYGQMVGNQAYDQNLTQLYDRGMELYDRAYQKWLDEQQGRLDAFNATGQMEDRAYGQYRDTVGDWEKDRDWATDRYDTERGFDYNKYRDQVSDWQNSRDFAANRYDTERNFDYGQYMDRQQMAENQYQFDTEMQEKQRQFNETINWERLTDQQKYYAEYVNSMLAMGQMPSAEMLKAAGLNEADAKKLLAQLSKGGGGSKAASYVTDALGNIYLADANGQPMKDKNGYAIQADWGAVTANDTINSYYQDNPLASGGPYTQAMVGNTTKKTANTGVDKEKVNTVKSTTGTAAKDTKKKK